MVCLLTPNVYDFQGTMLKRIYQQRQNNVPHIFQVRFTDSGKIEIEKIQFVISGKEQVKMYINVIE